MHSLSQMSQILVLKFVKWYFKLPAFDWLQSNGKAAYGGALREWTNHGVS